MSCDGEASGFSAYSRLFSPVATSSAGGVAMAPLTVGGANAEKCGFDGLLAEVSACIGTCFIQSGYTDAICALCRLLYSRMHLAVPKARRS